MEHLYTTEEAAAKLKIHHDTMRDYLRHHKIAGVKFGRFWRVRESDLNAFILKNLTQVNSSVEEKSPHDFMEMLDESASRINAGTLQPITSDDISNVIAKSRP